MLGKTITPSWFELTFCVFFSLNATFALFAKRPGVGVTGLLGAFVLAFMAFLLLMLLVKIIIWAVRRPDSR
jgi:hypothetical protein